MNIQYVHKWHNKYYKRFLEILLGIISFIIIQLHKVQEYLINKYCTRYTEKQK